MAQCRAMKEMMRSDMPKKAMPMKSMPMKGSMSKPKKQGKKSY